MLAAPDKFDSDNPLEGGVHLVFYAGIILNLIGSFVLASTFRFPKGQPVMVHSWSWLAQYIGFPFMFFGFICLAVDHCLSA